MQVCWSGCSKGSASACPPPPPTHTHIICRMPCGYPYGVQSVCASTCTHAPRMGAWTHTYTHDSWHSECKGHILVQEVDHCLGRESCFGVAGLEWLLCGRRPAGYYDGGRGRLLSLGCPAVAAVAANGLGLPSLCCPRLCSACRLVMVNGMYVAQRRLLRAGKAGCTRCRRIAPQIYES